MIPCNCEREPEILAATRLGQMSPDLQTHARECPACSELSAVSALLQEASVLSAQEYEILPPADFLWQKARERARQTAAAKALRPIRWMTAFAVVAFAAFPALGVLSPFERQWFARWFAFLDTTFSGLFGSLSAFSGPTVLLGCSSMLLFLALSSWCVLRSE
jgi:hypothetical protein